MSGTVDIVHLFSERRAELERRLEKLRGLALPMGFVDVKVCAVTDVWSGLKLVIRKELR